MYLLLYVGPTYVSIVDHVGVSESLLSRKCSSEHLRKIADFVPNWRELAMSLGIQKGYIIDINSDRQLTGPVMKAQSVLDQWHRSNGFMASHKMLIQAFISQGDADLAERVCRIAKKGQWQVYTYCASFDIVLCLQNWRQIFEVLIYRTELLFSVLSSVYKCIYKVHPFYPPTQCTYHNYNQECLCLCTQDRWMPGADLFQ